MSDRSGPFAQGQHDHLGTHSDGPAQAADPALGSVGRFGLGPKTLNVNSRGVLNATLCRVIGCPLKSSEPVTQLPPETLDAARSAFKDSCESLSVMIDGRLKLHRRMGLSSTPYIIPSHDPIEITRSDPSSKLLDSADRNGVSEAQL